MIIGIDGNEANVNQRVGVSVYTYQLLSHFQKKANKNLAFRVYLRKKPLSDMPQQTEHFTYCIIPGRFAWSRIHFSLHLFKEQLSQSLPDIFFAPAHYSPLYCPIPLVVTIHDLSFFPFPDEFLKKDLYKLKKWTEISVRKAQKIITVSKATKKDVMRYYEVENSKIEVVYNGFQQKKAEKSKNDVLKEYRLKKNNYIFYLGTVQPRKNILTLIRAIDELRKTHPEMKLVVAGKKGWKYDEIYAEMDKRDYVVATGYETWEAICSLYQSAFCFVLPSLYEGFGIPILEAMSCGAPVIASQTSSLPEIGGNACLYFDPTDHMQLVEELEELYDNDALRSRLIAQGKKRVQEFSWQKSAQQTLDLLTS
ncbi:glycosyltransferase family 4 protein [Candidatus Woesebacteria bacterium]|nr:glycosyltransferase family 4 protein [Candidatus Woesebacteria bacterium]